MIYPRWKNFSQVQTKNYNVQGKIQPIQVNGWLALLEMLKWVSSVPGPTISSTMSPTGAKADTTQE